MNYKFIYGQDKVYMIKGNKVYDPLTNTWSTGYWIKDNKGNYYPVWQY